MSRRVTRSSAVKNQDIGVTPLQERQNKGEICRKRGEKRHCEQDKETSAHDKKPKKQVVCDIKQEPIDTQNNESKTITFMGSAPVDDQCSKCMKNYHVFVNGESVYNAMLNQTNVGRNNNKYYLLQLLKHNKKSQYCVWFRWGRVGKTAGTNLQELPLGRAIEVFEKKFHDKTKNLWEMRKCFEKFEGKYDLLEMDYGADKKTAKVEPTTGPKTDSKLPKSLQEFVELIFDVHEFEESVKEMQYNVKKAPLGNLTKNQIKAGYSTLKSLENCMMKNNYRGLVQACNEFYTRIPHDFGMRRPPIIHSVEEIKSKLELLQALGDIQVAITVIDQSEESSANEHPLDARYKSLNCELCALDRESAEFKLVELYTANTHAATHRNYNLEVVNVFSVSKPQVNQMFRTDLGNRMLLWHGSRLTNWCSILQQGLKIAPPEAPNTGYMFGKGVYFADMVSKSANYCFASQRQPYGFLLLCDVALGRMCDKRQADYDGDKLSVGFNSTRGIGKTQPNPDENVTMETGVVVPCGKPVAVLDNKSSALLYNEYVVYNVNQISPMYLVQLKFDFIQSW